MSNYSTLTENTLMGLSEMAGILYLKLLDAYQGHSSAANERKAFYAACHFDNNAGDVLDYILRNNPVHNLPEKIISELSEFFAARWRNNFMEDKA